MLDQVAQHIEYLGLERDDVVPSPELEELQVENELAECVRHQSQCTVIETQSSRRIARSGLRYFSLQRAKADLRLHLHDADVRFLIGSHLFQAIGDAGGKSR